MFFFRETQRFCILGTWCFLAECKGFALESSCYKGNKTFVSTCLRAWILGSMQTIATGCKDIAREHGVSWDNAKFCEETNKKNSGGINTISMLLHSPKKLCSLYPQKHEIYCAQAADKTRGCTIAACVSTHDCLTQKTRERERTWHHQYLNNPKSSAIY